VLSGAEVVLPDRILSPGTLAIDGDRIADIRPGAAAGRPGETVLLAQHYVVPGFIDVHVHGVEGFDALGPDGSVGSMAAALPKYGVTAFCPTMVACPPGSIARVLSEVARARRAIPAGARVLPAHLESSFINPAFAGAQPAACLRVPRPVVDGGAATAGDFTSEEVLRAIELGVPDLAVVTLAPELDGGVDLVSRLVSLGLRVSLGHSGADYDVACAAIAAGARRATHLFNRMPPLDHHEPGLVGAVLEAEEVAAEIICDGVHVHPSLVGVTVGAKRPARVMAVTDGTALSGLAPGARAQLGQEQILADGLAARLADGTLAGSTSTMDRIFRLLVDRVGLSLVDAATVTATTPARELGLVGHGLLAAGAVADLVVLDRAFSVARTYVGGQLMYARSA